MIGLSTRRGVLALAAAAVFALGAVDLRQVSAHEGKCPVCKLDVVQDTDKLDNEVALKSGRKRIEYRCVACALQDSATYGGDLTILAPSEIKGKPVRLARTEGKWTTSPESAVFIAHRVGHKSCQLGYRALTTREALPRWLQTHQELPKDARTVSLAALLELSKTER